MMKNLKRFPEFELEAAEMVRCGETANDVVEFLKSNQLSITQSIVTIKSIYSVSLGEAKSVVCNAPCWSPQANAFTQEMYGLLEEE